MISLNPLALPDLYAACQQAKTVITVAILSGLYGSKDEDLLALDAINAATLKAEQPSSAITPKQEQALADAIANAVIKAGMIRPDAALTGPLLLQFVDDLATAYLSTEKALLNARRTVDGLIAYGEAKFGDEFWPGNAKPWLGDEKGEAFEQLIEHHEPVTDAALGEHKV